MREAKLVEERAHDLCSFDARDLLTELEEFCMRAVEVEEERAVEAGELVVLVIEASNALMDLEMLPICEVPQTLKRALEVLKVVSVNLERLREAHASGTGP
jgi:hypothetical protein